MPKIFIPDIPEKAEDKQAMFQELQQFSSIFRMGTIFKADKNSEGKSTEPDYEKWLASGGEKSPLTRINDFLNNVKNDPENSMETITNVEALQEYLKSFENLGRASTINSINEMDEDRLDQIGAFLNDVLGGDVNNGISDAISNLNRSSDFKYAESPEMRALVDITGAINKAKVKFDSIAIDAENKRYSTREKTSKEVFEGLEAYAKFANELDDKVAEEFPGYNVIGVIDLMPKLAEGISDLDEKVIPHHEAKMQKAQEDLAAAKNRQEAIKEENITYASVDEGYKLTKAELLEGRDKIVKEIDNLKLQIEGLKKKNEELEKEVSLEDAEKAKSARENKIDELDPEVAAEYKEKKAAVDELQQLMSYTAEASSRADFKRGIGIVQIDKNDAEMLKTENGRKALQEKYKDNDMGDYINKYIALKEGFERYYDKYNPKPAEPAEPPKKSFFEKIGLKKAEPQKKHYTGEERFNQMIAKAYDPKKSNGMPFYQIIQSGLSGLTSKAMEEMVDFKEKHQDVRNTELSEENREDKKYEINQLSIADNKLSIDKLNRDILDRETSLRFQDKYIQSNDEAIAKNQQKITDNNKEFEELNQKQVELKETIVKRQLKIKQATSARNELKEARQTGAHYFADYNSAMEQRQNIINAVNDIKSTKPLSFIQDNRLQQIDLQRQAFINRAGDCMGNHNNSDEFKKMLQGLSELKGASAKEMPDKLDKFEKGVQEYLDAKNKQVLPKIFGGSKLRHTRLNYAKEMLKWAQEAKESMKLQPKGKLISDAEKLIHETSFDNIRDFSKDTPKDLEFTKKANEMKLERDAEVNREKGLEDPIKKPVELGGLHN